MAVGMLLIEFQAVSSVPSALVGVVVTSITLAIADGSRRVDVAVWVFSGDVGGIFLHAAATQSAAALDIEQ